MISEIGGNLKYYCLILSDFDPIKAKKIYNEATLEEVTQAILARELLYRPEDE